MTFLSFFIMVLTKYKKIIAYSFIVGGLIIVSPVFSAGIQLFFDQFGILKNTFSVGFMSFHANWMAYHIVGYGLIILGIIIPKKIKQKDEN